MQRISRITVLCVLFCLLFLAVPMGMGHAQENTEPPIRLALLPSLLPGDAQPLVHVLVNSLYDVLEELETIVPVFSCYPGDSRYHPQPIPPDRVNPGDLRRIWVKKSFFTPRRPDADLVFRIGRKLGVDLAILYSIQITGTGTDRLYVYLFDIKGKRTISKRISDEIKHNYTNEISEVILASRLREITRQVLDRF